MSAVYRLLRSAMFLLLAILSLQSFAKAHPAVPHSSTSALRAHQSIGNSADDDDDDDDEDEDDGEGN